MRVSYCHSGGLGNRINSAVASLALELMEGKDKVGVCWHTSRHCGAKFDDILCENDHYVKAEFDKGSKSTISNFFDGKYLKICSEFGKFYELAASYLEWSDEVNKIFVPTRFSAIHIRWNGTERPEHKFERKHSNIDNAIGYLNTLGQTFYLACDNQDIKDYVSSRIKCSYISVKLSDEDLGDRGKEATILAAAEMKALCKCDVIYQLGGRSSFTHLPVYGYKVTSFILDTIG